MLVVIDEGREADVAAVGFYNYQVQCLDCLEGFQWDDCWSGR